ncbi:MAG: 1-deoxy-D-xylulose-5-phosphate synthase [Lachnospiraceae bacterium]|nr:1-deoxy-D-xylulose-5-phosphate synthase [Lachnospiraceae bacterium]
MVLDKINQPNDIKKLEPEEVIQLSDEIREFLIDKLSKTGGHIASNLGVVELTIALHLICDLPKDKIIWDVGHQSYTHKILTGRKDGFDNLRQFGGMSGFPKRAESDCDVFDTGHSTTSISAGLGMVWAREMRGEDYKVISVIGDGSMTGGMSFEALNNASELKKNFVIVLNDNEMSISKNVGGVSEHLSKMRTSDNYMGLKEDVMHSLEKIPVYGDKIITQIQKTKSGIKSLVIPGMMYEEMGIMYIGPIDGHDINAMVKVFQEASRYQGPVIVHVRTKKGKGFVPAERHPSRFHGAGPFDVEKGLPLKSGKASYTNIFSTVMRKMGDRDRDIVAITAAMSDGVGLKRFSNMFPDRFFDVGIAEQHAVTFAAGLATQGFKPIFAVYSSFLQRAYDQIMHDVCMQNLHVVFAIDRAGLVGADGMTHHGAFDISYLSQMPNMVVMAPKNKWELSDMVKFAFNYDGPIAIRYPRGEAFSKYKEFRAPIELGKSEEIFEGDDVLLYALGSMYKNAIEVAKLMRKDGKQPTVCNARFAKPLDEEYIVNASKKHKCIVTLEDNVYTGGIGERINNILYRHGYEGEIINISLPDEFVEHGSVEKLQESLGMDPKSIYDKIKKSIGA